jgi:hypothetical protein
MHHHSSLTGLNYLISIRAVFASGTRHEAQAPHEVEGRQHRQRGWPSIIGEATWPLRQKKNQVRLVVGLSSKEQGGRKTQKQWPLGFHGSSAHHCLAFISTLHRFHHPTYQEEQKGAQEFSRNFITRVGLVCWLSLELYIYSYV